MNILDKIKKISENNKKLDLNQILDLAAKESGYKIYTREVSDFDLDKGLNLLVDRYNLTPKTTCSSYYEGKLL